MTALILLGLFCYCCYVIARDYDPQKSGVGVISVGQQAILRSHDRGPIPVAVSEAALDSLTDASFANDEHGINQMLLLGQVVLVPHGTRVLVLDRDFTSAKIRILEGNYSTRGGWVRRHLISRN